MVQQRKYTYQENDFLTEYHFPYKCLPVKIFEQLCYITYVCGEI